MSLINFNGGNNKNADGLINLDLSSIIFFITKMPRHLKSLVITSIIVGCVYFFIFKDYVHNNNTEEINKIENTLELTSEKVELMYNVILKYDDIVKINNNDIALISIFLEENEFVQEKYLTSIIEYMKTTDKGNDIAINRFIKDVQTTKEYSKKYKKYLNLESSAERETLYKEINERLNNIKNINNKNNSVDK